MSQFVAHDTAYYDTNILHPNINVGSIIISEGGFLVDFGGLGYVCPF